jgi:uncharacterized protein involved in response to NO
MIAPRVIPLRVTQGQPSAEARATLDRRWRARYLLLAPHRLAFFLAMVVLVTAGAWWALVQLDQVSTLVALPYAASPALVHGAVMTFGFMPLFFSGFLFTAGTKWLGVPPLRAQQLLAPLLLQAAGWLGWLFSAHLALLPGSAGLALALAGLAWITGLFWRLIRISQAQDRLHARVIGVACIVGCLSLAGLLLSLVLEQPAVALAWVVTGLWGFVLVVFVSVAHRMIPFFTSSALPFMASWHPFWVLWLMLAVATMEVAWAWLAPDGPLPGLVAPAWLLARGMIELAAGAVLLWSAWAWGLTQSLKNRLLAMLYAGFSWLGLALLLGGASQLLGWAQSAPVLALGSLHALTMGCLASLMLAMVTRVSCGHGGRALVADRLVWSLFWLLQLATVLRIAAAAQGALGSRLLPPAALLWAGVMAVWGVRLGAWYGRLRVDGRAG